MRTLVVLAAAAGVAHAEPTVAARTGPPTGVAIGVELGQPSTVTVRWATLAGKLGVGAGVGTGTLDGTGLTIRGGVTFAPVVLAATPRRAVPLFVGVGARYYAHHYDPASIDELPDRHVGLEATVGAALVLRASRLEVYLDGGPGYDVGRSDSCGFASGVATLCPHQGASRLYLHAAVGLRWYLGVGG
ncbi:MAG: hypothetical protein IPL61_12050 [Myxococcales bacterium]|nr:hypothetical protein [Myxococcales bacterium]